MEDFEHNETKNEAEIEQEKQMITENDEEHNETTLAAVHQFQSKQHNYTCMMPNDMASDVIVNNKPFPINAPCPESDQPFKIAPGEGKIPTNRMREQHEDAKAFPKHHPTWKYGLNYE